MAKLNLFHGTNADFAAFDERFLGAAHGLTPTNLAGFHFTDSREVAATFGKHVLVCEVSMERPRVLDARGVSYAEFKHRLNDVLECIDRTRYDGILVRRYADAGTRSDELIVSTHFIAFSPGQVVIRSRECSA